MKFAVLFSIVLGTSIVTATLAHADDPPANKKPNDAPEPTFALSDEVREALLPLFRRVHDAKVTRTTVEMLNDSLVNGVEVDRRSGVFQIASQSPDKFTIYLKEPSRRTRLYCNGKSLIAALAPDAYVDLGKAIDLQTVVTDVPVIMGTYPEPILALSVAGVDPAISFLGGMDELKIVDDFAFGDEQIPAKHLVGMQTDGVKWDLWIRADDDPQPLRMLVDLTPMLYQSRKMDLPAGYSQQIRYDFLSYRTSGEVDDSLFAYDVKADTKQYESIESYYHEQSEEESQHPMTGETAPAFRAADLDGNVVDTRELSGRVLVIDFWASWCKPCLEMLPVIQDVVSEMDDKKVAFLSINTGEKKSDVAAFVKQQKMQGQTLLDEHGKIADGYQADRIPQTTIVSPDGKVYKVLTGFSDSAAVAKRLKETIEAALEME